MSEPQFPPPPEFPIANMIVLIRVVLRATDVVAASYLGGDLRATKRAADYSYRLKLHSGWSAARLTTPGQAAAVLTTERVRELVGMTITDVSVQADRRLQLAFDDGVVLEVEGGGPFWTLSEHDATGATHGELTSQCDAAGCLGYAAELEGAGRDLQLDEALGWGL